MIRQGVMFDDSESRKPSRTEHELEHGQPIQTVTKETRYLESCETHFALEAVNWNEASAIVLRIQGNIWEYDAI